MYCNNCGKRNPEDGKFCQFCGAKLTKKIITEGEVKTTPQDSTAVTAGKEKLTKAYRNAGGTSYALSIVSLVLTLIVQIINSSFPVALLNVLLGIPFVAPFFIFGRKLNKQGLDDIPNSLNISKWMALYTLLYIGLAAAMKQGVGFLWLLVLFYYYEAYKESKFYLENKFNPPSKTKLKVRKAFSIFSYIIIGIGALLLLGLVFIFVLTPKG